LDILVFLIKSQEMHFEITFRIILFLRNVKGVLTNDLDLNDILP